MKHQRIDLGRPWSAQQALLMKHAEVDMRLWDIEMLLTRIRAQFYFHTAVIYLCGLTMGLALANLWLKL